MSTHTYTHDEILALTNYGKNKDGKQFTIPLKQITLSDNTLEYIMEYDPKYISRNKYEKIIPEKSYLFLVSSGRFNKHDPKYVNAVTEILLINFANEEVFSQACCAGYHDSNIAEIFIRSLSMSHRFERAFGHLANYVLNEEGNYYRWKATKSLFPFVEQKKVRRFICKLFYLYYARETNESDCMEQILQTLHPYLETDKHVKLLFNFSETADNDWLNNYVKIITLRNDLLEKAALEKLVKNVGYNPEVVQYIIMWGHEWFGSKEIIQKVFLSYLEDKVNDMLTNVRVGATSTKEEQEDGQVSRMLVTISDNNYQDYYNDLLNLMFVAKYKVKSKSYIIAELRKIEVESYSDDIDRGVIQETIQCILWNNESDIEDRFRLHDNRGVMEKAFSAYHLSLVNLYSEWESNRKISTYFRALIHQQFHYEHHAFNKKYKEEAIKIMWPDGHIPKKLRRWYK